jgi:AsmA family
MTKSTPLLLLVATITLVLAALLAFWIALMPQRILHQIAERFRSEQGSVLEARNPRLRFDRGLVLQLESVTLTDGSDNTAALTARDMSMNVGVSALFGGAVIADTVTLNAPVLNIDVAAKSNWKNLPARTVIVREGVIKLRDATRKAVVALSDVNGSLTTGEGVKLDISFLQNGAITSLVADAESMTRLVDSGSPVDISVSAKDRILSFSGRAVFNNGLALDGQLTAEGSDTGTMMDWLGMPLQTLKTSGPLSLTAGVSVTGLSATLNTVTGKFAGQDIKGQMNIQAGPDRMKLTADLTMAALNVLPQTSLLTAPWSEKPFNIADLNGLDADVKIKGDRLSLRGVNQGPVDLALTTTDGATLLDITLPATKIFLAIKPENQNLQIDAAVEAKSVDAKIFLGGLLGFDRMSGPLDVTLKTSAQGVSPAALVSTLKGNINMTSKKATIDGIDLATALNSPHQGWQASGTSAAIDLAVEAKLDEGVATFGKADITVSGNTVKLKGDIDLLRQAFNISIAPKGKVQAIRGTWVSPLFAADAGTAPPMRPATVPAN